MGNISNFDLAPYCSAIGLNRKTPTQGVLHLNMGSGCHDNHCNMGAKRVLENAPLNIVLGSRITISCPGCPFNLEGFPQTEAEIT